MKKSSIFLMSLLSIAFVGCSDNYDPAMGPQSYLPESPISASDVSVTNTATSIKIADYIDEKDVETPIPLGTFSVKEGAMPANTIMKAEIEISQTEDFAKSAIVEANSLASTQEITIQPSDLEDAYFYGISKNPATTDLYIRTIMYTQTKGDAVARIGKPDETYFATSKITFTPLNRVSIAPAYYIVGGPNDWQASAINRSIKFEHSDEDVYIDPIFTVVFDAAASGDTWFAIGDDLACDAIAAGDWSQLYGIVGGESEAKSGQLDRRSNLGGDNSFCIKAGAKKIKVTIDMMEQTFQVEEVNIAEAYYLIGGEKGWSEAEALTQPFTHSEKSVFEDPIFSYVINGGAERWFSFGDASQIAATTAGDWNQLYGYVGEQTDKGTFGRRADIGGENTFHVDGSAKFYRFTVNMLTMEYEITPLNFDPYIYYIGSTDGWSKAEQRLALTDESGIYTGFLYCADPNGWGNEFKFQKVPGDWDTEINTGMMTGGITGDFADGGGNFKANAGEGVYYVTLNMANMSINAVKVEKMGIIGDFNGWGGDVEMTWNATDYCFEATNAGVTANGWKFRVNSDWGINLGANDSVEPSTVTTDLVANGKNLGVAGSTVKLYPTRKTSDNIYCTVE